MQIFHAGTKRDGKRILADGGRVLGVTARGANIRQAQARAYAAVDKIDWPAASTAATSAGVRCGG